MRTLRASHAVPVLMFHGLARAIPPYAQHPGTRSCILKSADFEKVVRWCAERYKFIRASELEGYLTEGGEPAVVLTFDDALASVVDIAVPVLEKYGACATTFVSSDWTDGAKTPLIFKLERFLWESIPTAVTVRAGKETLRVGVGSSDKVQGAIIAIWDFLFAMRTPPLTLRDADIEVDGTDGRPEGVADDREFWFPASWNELASAADRRVLELGVHGAAHVPLTWFAPDDLKRDLVRCADRIAQATGHVPTTCSYPHGFVDDAAAKTAGDLFDWAFTSVSERVTGRTPRARAPRFHVPTGKSAAIELVVKHPALAEILRRAKVSVGTLAADMRH